MKNSCFRVSLASTLLTVFLYAQIELPRSTSNQIVSHTGYTLSYNEEHEQADWVAYKLTASEVRAAMDRTNDYRADPKVRTGSASLHDYKGSGHDHKTVEYAIYDNSFYLIHMIEGIIFKQTGG